MYRDSIYLVNSFAMRLEYSKFQLSQRRFFEVSVNLALAMRFLLLLQQVNL